MFKKSLTLILVLLMMSPLFIMTNENPATSPQTTPLDSVSLAETVLERVNCEGNVFPNDGVEEWSNPHQPIEFSIARTEETDAWLESTIVNEGSHSIGLEARAMDINHAVDAYLRYQSQGLWDNPINLTLNLDWYLDSIGTPVDQDYIRIDININYKHLYYYLGCETAYTNYTSNAYFEIEGSFQTWNHLYRNLTADYIQMFGETPTQYREIEWNIKTYTGFHYTRVFLDDLNLVNGTTTIYGGSIREGNFEIMGLWQTGFHNGAGDVAQSSMSHSGSWSMNLTAVTTDDIAYAHAFRGPDKLLTADNQANLSFWWNLEDYVNPGLATYARVVVTAINETHEVDMFYYMFVGGSGMLPVVTGENLRFAVDGFNVTDVWNHFDRNIWEDYTTYHNTENLWIEQISFQVRNYNDDTRLTLLVDDITFAPSLLNGMDFENQNAVGARIQGWDQPPGISEFTVTDFAKSGSNAANLTLVDDYVYLEQKLHDLEIDSTTELIFDFNVYIDTFNQSSEDYVLFNFYFDDQEFAYVIVNSSSAFEDDIEDEGGAKFIILQDTLVTGEWLNFQLDIVHDYELLFGDLPDTTTYSVSLLAEAIAGSRLSVIFDDEYIYYDPAPEITGVNQNPTSVDEVGDLVWIYANVTDVSDLTVTLSYRVNTGAWTNVTMEESAIDFRVDINAAWGVTDYFITAEDSFGKTDVAMDGGDYFSFSTVDSVAPTITIDPANGSTVEGVQYITINVIETGSGFAGSELFIEGVSLANNTASSVGIPWDTTVVPNGVYNITVVAEDNAGNTASVTHLMTVENVGDPADLTGVILIIVVVAIIGAIAVIYIFILKKK